MTIIEINGIEYYAPADYVDYIVVVGDAIVNTSNSTIYLYRNLREYNNSQSGYPRITLQPYYKGYIQNSYNSTASTLVVDEYKVKARKFNDSFMISLLIFFALLLIWFKRS